MAEFGVSVPARAAFDAVGFGLNAVDHLCVVPRYPEVDSKTPILSFARTAGGQAASAMVVLARFGLRVKYVGKVGGDETGAFSLASLRAEGVDVSDVPAVPGVTNQVAMIIVDQRNGERTILWHRPREIATRPDEITPEKVAVGRVLLVDGHDAPAAARAAAVARERGIPVVLDAETVKEGNGRPRAARGPPRGVVEVPGALHGRVGRGGVASPASRDGATLRRHDARARTGRSR